MEDPAFGSPAAGNISAPILVHFGDGDFAGKYQTLIENIAQWQATAGNIRTVDLRFNREAVVNSDTAYGTARQAKIQRIKAQQVKPAKGKGSQSKGQQGKGRKRID